MKIGMVSLGCPKNLVDSEVMLGLAQQQGHQLTRDAADADVLIVNTCAFIDKAKQESIDTILEMAEHKKTGACRRLVVTGCMAERYRDELRAQIPEIDAVLGTGEVPEIVRTAIRRLRTATGSAEASCEGGERDPSDGSRASRYYERTANRSGSRSETRRPETCRPTSTTRALRACWPPPSLRLREDCRGLRLQVRLLHHPDAAREVPQPHARVDPGEAERLAAQGVKELLLISQDTTFYGIDRGERGALARLLRALNRVDGLEWIRMLYLYPTTITDDVLEAMAESEKVCKYVDLPLQHASDPVLKRMKRPGTRASYERLLDRIRQRVPGVTLRTTFIVGFPGETPEDYAELQSFVEAVALRSRRRLHLFARRRHVGARSGRRCARVGEEAAPERRDATAEADRRTSAAREDRKPGSRPRGRPIGRA